jgi:hypothetical protein
MLLLLTVVNQWLECDGFELWTDLDPSVKKFPAAFGGVERLSLDRADALDESFVCTDSLRCTLLYTFLWNLGRLNVSLHGFVDALNVSMSLERRGLIQRLNHLPYTNV